MNKQFILINNLAKKGEYKYGGIYSSYKNDLKSGRTDRFMKLDGKVYVDKNYPLVTGQADKIKRITELYYDLIDSYKNEYYLSKDLAKYSDISIRSFCTRLNNFSFIRDTDKVLEAFENLYASR